jgi:hypothetical protein
VRAFVTMVVIAGVAGGWSAPAGAKTSDQQIAKAAVLTEADVPSGFTGGPFTEKGDDPTLPECEGAIAKADKSVELAPIARSGFQLNSTTGYAVIENTVAVLPSEKKAKQAMAAYSDEDTAEVCMQARFEESFTETGITTSVSMGSFDPEMDPKGNEKVIKGGDEFLGFGGGVRRSAGGAPQFFEVQVVLAREGRAVTQLAIVTQGTIPRDDMEQMLQTVVTRMGKA